MLIKCFLIIKFNEKKGCHHQSFSSIEPVDCAQVCKHSNKIIESKNCFINGIKIS